MFTLLFLRESDQKNELLNDSFESVSGLQARCPLPALVVLLDNEIVVGETFRGEWNVRHFERSVRESPLFEP